MKSIKIIFIILFTFIFSCSQKFELGSKNNPVEMCFVPWMETGKIITRSKKLTKYLTERTGYHFRVTIPTNYAAVIEGMGTEEVDIAWLPPFAYVLANEKFGAQVALTPVRKGMKKYKGEFLVRSDSDIDILADIEGKTIAYTDAASTSGYIFPSALLSQMGIKPGKVYFAGGHSQAILAVYQNRADVGCAYWSPPSKEGPQDGRKALLQTHPDIYEKTKIIGYTDWIMNDTVTFRKDFPIEMKEKIIQALIDYLKISEGREVMKTLYEIDDYVRSTDSDYDGVRKALQALGTDASKYIR
ncbi:MAG: phosphate/phosphite/phosphonate ABC transporter substrate-binding protein [Candidatus Cloacimonetes bacterium]|nr:phosphate/phosphite/phosphonate ABC transporter substrate-binding protein [Candidatus Cloacimonadota bacterium]